MKLLKHWVVEDCGTIINPQLVDEQIRGGVVQGLGAALFEKCIYDERGQLTNANMADYLVPMSGEMPDIEVGHVVSPTRESELGAKGAGEAGTAGAAAAVTNAVNDALKPFRTIITEIPADASGYPDGPGANLTRDAAGKTKYNHVKQQYQGEENSLCRRRFPNPDRFPAAACSQRRAQAPRLPPRRSASTCCRRNSAPIKIGMSMPQTGGLAGGGKPSLLGIEIWRDDVNAKGGLLGRKVELVVYDDKSSASETPAIYSKLIDVDKVDLLFAPYATVPTAPIMPLVKQRGLLLIGNFSFQVNSKVGHDMWFNNAPWGPPDSWASSFLDIGQKAGGKSIALLTADQEFAQNLVKTAREIASEA